MQSSIHTVDGKRVECKYAFPKENKKKKKKIKKAKKALSEDQFQAGKESRKMFVGGLPKSATEDDLFDYFSSFGELEDYVVMVDRET